ncbi:MAG: aldehyde dehydrogenase family protein [Saprospiraceae bacterium]|nr:aldehyde dehydrogenase family protein [Saprospiraceae bacterium]
MIQLPTGIQLQEKTLAFLAKTQHLFMGGEWTAPAEGQYFPTLNPANAEVLAEIPLATSPDIDQAVAAARHAFQNHWHPKIKPAKRSQLIHKLADLMQRDLPILMELETLDNGKPLNKAKYDVLGAINHFRYYAGWATKIEGTTIPVDGHKLVYTLREPLGVVGLIIPWNFPLMMAAWKLAPALACGNCCVLKPAEQTPLSALYLCNLIQEAGFPAGVVNVVTGPGVPTGEAISQHMDIDKVSFTGSTVVGRKIMTAAASSNLKKVSLELGGKSPNVIFADADLKAVSQSALWSSFYNTGQECTLGSRLYVERPVYEEFITKLKEQAEQLSIGNGLTNPDLGPVVSQKQLDRVLNYIQVGQNEGAELITGGERCTGALSDGYFLHPTIFGHTNDDLQVVQEEIFGPVVVVSPFDKPEEAISRANHTRYGLAAAVWTQDISKAHRFAQATQAGTVWINGYDLFDPAVPFGGHKESGIGAEMGRSAIDLYTQEKSVWVNLK